MRVRILHATMHDFLDHLLMVQGAAENTISAYTYGLEKFHAYANGAPSEATAEMVTGFFQALASRGEASATIAQRYAALKGYFHHLHTRGAIAENPMAQHDRPKTRRPALSPLTQTEIIRLMEVEATPRDHAILELLYSGGLRVSELTRLNLSDVNLREGHLWIAGKGDRERIVPLSETAIAAIDLYLRQVRPTLKSRTQERALLLNYAGRRLSRQFIWKAVKDAAHRTRIDSKVTPEGLRLAFGAHLLEKGVDPRSVQEFLGHADHGTTMTLARSVRAKREEVAA